MSEHDDHTTPSAPPTTRPPVVGNVSLVVSGLLFLLPALIPLYYALDADKPQAIYLLVGMSITILIMNVVAFFLLVRWLQRAASRTSSD